MWRALAVVLAVLGWKAVVSAQNEFDPFGAPESAPVVVKVPLEPGLHIGLADNQGVRVTEVTPDTIRYDWGHDTPFERSVEDRANVGDPGLCIPLVVAKQLAEGVPGQTRVVLPRGRDVEPVQGEYLYTGTGLLPCVCNGRAALVRCWVLLSNLAGLCVMADPQNPLIMEALPHYPGPQLAIFPPPPQTIVHRIVSIDAAGTKFGALTRPPSSG